MEVFEKAHQAGKLTPLGEDVRKRLAIVWADAEGRGGDLSPVGVDQQRGIAERMYQAFPEVFKGAPEMSACATLVIRCVLSMDAFCERLKEFNPQLKIERESSNKYMPYLNFHYAGSHEVHPRTRALGTRSSANSRRAMFVPNV